MENGLFAYILKYSKRQQIVLTLMTIASFPFYYLSLDLPKTIINDAISGTRFPVDASIDIAGLHISFGTYEQVPYLLLLCLAFLLLVLVNSGFKLFINIYRGVLGERMLRRMRLQLIDRIMRFPLHRFRRTSQGELVSMVNQETEPLGGFIGEAISLPLYQGGLLLTILVFMFVQDWKLGLAAIALYPVQAWLIPKLQRQVNLLNQHRTIRMRSLAENLGEVVAGINEVHINDNSTFFKDHFSKLLGGIFNIRVQIYKKKFLIKFLNNSFAQLTPFLFFLIGGLLVIQGDLSVGALVAALAAYKDLSPPWKELLSWYQGQADARLKYSILTEQFEIEDDTQPSKDTLTEHTSEEPSDLSINAINASNVSLIRADGVRVLDNVSLNIEKADWVSLVGSGTSGKNALARIIARLTNPTDGKILIGGKDARRIPSRVSGRSIAYAGHDSYLFSETIRNNLLLSLKFKPQTGKLDDYQTDQTIQFHNWQEEARLSGNSDVALDTDWVDYASAGAGDAEQLTSSIESVLSTVGVADDLVRNALARNISPEDYPELTDSILKARSLFKEQVHAQGLGSVVEFLNPDRFNENTSLAENILFGASHLDTFSTDGLTRHPELQALLHEHGLAKKLDQMAIDTATTMVELFSDLPSGHDFFARYNLLDADDLVQIRRILASLRKGKTIDTLKVDDNTLIRALPFRMIGGRHRVGILDEKDKLKIVAIRQQFANRLDKNAREQIDFFSADRYNAFTSISENIIFGRVVYGRLGAEEKVHELMIDVLTSVDLIAPLLNIGLTAPAGLAGSLLSVPQRQKLILARGLIKRPDILVVNDGLSAMDDDETEATLHNIKRDFPDMSVLWTDSRVRLRNLFDRYAHVQAGNITKLEEAAENPDESQPDNRSTNRRSISVDDNDKLAFLSSIPLFRMMDEHHLFLLARSCDTVTISAGERLFNQGDPGDALYVVAQGKAGIIKSDNGNEHTIGEYGVNEVIGELALLSSNPRAASVNAVTDLELLRLKREAFVDIVRSNGEIGYQILQVVINRFVHPERTLEHTHDS